MKLIFSILFFLLLLSCSKENTLTKVSFSVGKIEKNSIYTKFEPEIEIIGIDRMKNDNILVNNNQDSLDVDNDGKYDIGFETVYNVMHIDITMDAYRLSTSTYYMNPDFQIAMKNVEDWYSYIDSLTSDTIKIYNTDKPELYPSITNWEKTQFYEPTRPIEFKEGEDPFEYTEWNVEPRCYLSYRDSSYYYRTGEPFLMGFDDYTYGVKGLSEYKYIVFRKLDTKCYYGWIKLRITDFNKISISESYFQNDEFDY